MWRVSSLPVVYRFSEPDLPIYCAGANSFRASKVGPAGDGEQVFESERDAAEFGVEAHNTDSRTVSASNRIGSVAGTESASA